MIGAIYGCHVRISIPSESEESYYNRKKFHSIILQGTCNADMDVFAGLPGSAHNTKMLQESFSFQRIKRKLSFMTRGQPMYLLRTLYTK